MLIAFLFAASAQLFFWGLFYRYSFPSSAYKVPEETGPFAPVSVIVCFRNEEAGISRPSRWSDPLAPTRAYQPGQKRCAYFWYRQRPVRARFTHGCRLHYQEPLLA